MELEVKAVLICHDKRIADGLSQYLGGHGEIVCFRVLAVCGGHLDLAGLRERSALTIRRPVFRRADRRVIRTFAEELQRVCEISVCQRVALDRAIDRAVGRAGGLTVGLPCELQIEVNAAFQPQHERKVNVRLHGFTLLVLLYGMGLHGQDIVLKLCTVRQRHVQHTARFRFLRYAVAHGNPHIGDLCIFRVETGEVQLIAQSAAVKLGKQYTLADRLSGRTDHGACL